MIEFLKGIVDDVGDLLMVALCVFVILTGVGNIAGQLFNVEARAQNMILREHIRHHHEQMDECEWKLSEE